jgi:hypothetical protein
MQTTHNMTFTRAEWLALYDALSMHVENEEADGDPDAESPSLVLLRPIVDRMTADLAATGGAS